MKRLSAGPEVVVVGGGISGCAVAIELLARGAQVTVVDRRQAGRGATVASGGMLTPQYESPSPTPDFRLGVRAREAWPAFAERLERLCDQELALRADGMLVANRDEEEEEEARETLAFHVGLGLRGEILRHEEARRHHPGVAEDPVSWLWLPDEAQLDIQRLAAALTDAVRAAGGNVRAGSAVTGIESSAGRVKGVRIEDDREVPADVVVVAAGAWSDAIAGLPRPLPVRPVRGQMLRLRSPMGVPGTLVADHRGHYLVPREDGTILLGSTMEDVGFEDAVTDEARGMLLGAAGSLVPAMGNATIVERWCGFRPISADGIPILGPDPEIEGLHYATGAGRRGILLAPLVGRVVAELVTAGATDVDWEEFSVTRFESGATAGNGIRPA
jgi:glycine oxidase